MAKVYVLNNIGTLLLMTPTYSVKMYIQEHNKLKLRIEFN